MAITQAEMADHTRLAQSGQGLEALGDGSVVRDVHLADALVAMPGTLRKGLAEQREATR